MGKTYLDTCLNFANLSKQDYKEALFYASELRHVDFSHSDFKGATFYKCDLRGASFEGANLENVLFSGGNLRGVNFENSNLVGTYFIGTIGVYQFGPIINFSPRGLAVDWGDIIMFYFEKNPRFWGTEEEAIKYIGGEDSIYTEQIRLAARIVKFHRKE